jgi:NAD(P)-dependent dehydrogenase (short-subunit alcohol dehydrogenase family)
MRDGTRGYGTVLVLGGGSDIGLAVAERLLRDGAHTFILAGRDPHRMAPAAQRLRQGGASTVELVTFDADEVECHEQMINQITARHGDLDLAIVAFGILGDQSRAEVDAQHALQVHRTIVLGGVSVLTHLGQLVRHQGHGDLVVLSSVAALRPRRANYVYGSAKAALDAFASGLSDRLTGSGAHVLVVRPGFVRSKMTRHLRVAPFPTEPRNVADTVAAALARGTRTVYVPRILGPTMTAVRWLPGPLFRRLSAREAPSPDRG